MELTPSQKKTVRHQFDSFCRKVLREEARDYERHIAWRSDHEVSLSELSEEQERQMYVLDEYPSEQTHFRVQGYDVAIENEVLANALTVLPDDKRDIEEKNRTYYEVYSLPVSEHPPEGYQAISLVCVRQDGRYESPATVSNVCRAAKKRVDGMESFHFHQLRHTFTSNLLSYGAAPKDVQELLGHSDVTTTMNIYAHASREAKRDAAKLLDKVQ